MPWPTDPASEFFGRGLWGWATSVWERITSNGSGALNVHIASQTGTQLIQQASPALLKPGVHTYVDGGWIEQGVIFSYHDEYRETVINQSHAAGVLTIKGTTVPAGYVYVVQAAHIMQVTSTGGYGWIRVFDGVDATYMGFNTSLTAGIPWPIFGTLTMGAGAYIQASFGTTVLNEGCYMGITGYQMRIS